MKSNTDLSWPSLLSQLSTMLEAGLPIASALNSLIDRSGERELGLQKAYRLVEKGVGLANAFGCAKLVGEFDYAMLQCAEKSGGLNQGLKHLAERKISQLQRVESFKASLAFPKALILLGAGAGVFIRTASAQQSSLEAFASIALLVAVFYLLSFIAVLIVKADTRIWMSWIWPYPSIHKHMKWYRLSLEYLLYYNLSWQISVGIVASDASRACSRLLASRNFQLRVNTAAACMDKGEAMTKSLEDQGLVLTKRMQQVLLIAEQSGTHEAAIRHELSLQRAELKLKADNFFKWASRFAYLIALVFISKLITA